MVRNCIAVDWALGLKGAIEGVVRAAFPANLRGWPLMHPCRFDAYTIGDTHLVLVLHDQVGGTRMVGPGSGVPFPHGDHPRLPRRAHDARQWQDYLNRTFTLRPEDATVIVPLHDSGSSSAANDFALFTQEERDLWASQVHMIVERQAALFATKDRPVNITNYYVQGPHSRVVVDSVDASTNIANDAHAVFEAVRTAVQDGLAAHEDKERLLRAVATMEESRGKPDAMKAYRDFMDLAAAHVTVLQPFFASLAALLFGA